MEVALFEARSIQLISQNFKLRIILIFSSCLELGRPMSRFRLGFFIEKLADILSINASLI